MVSATTQYFGLATSDNGPYKNGPANAAGLRGHKATVYEGSGIRVPAWYY